MKMKAAQTQAVSTRHVGFEKYKNVALVMTALCLPYTAFLSRHTTTITTTSSTAIRCHAA